jgi:protein phosphatase
VRRTNEDSCFISPERHLYIVSDGMGGHAGGEIASKAVVTVLPQLLEQRLAEGSMANTASVQLALRDAVVELGRQLRAQSTGHAGLQGLGATLAMACLSSRTAHLAHMGDSRIYLFRRGRLEQLTEDHSVIALLLKHGEITQAEAHNHPARGKLSRYVGMEGEVFPDVQSVRLQYGDRLLLCSDGLTGMIADNRIAKILDENPEPEPACIALVAAANDAGGVDNITAVVAIVEVGRRSARG